MVQHRFGVPLMVGSMLLICIFMFVYPQASLNAALRGLSIWWDVLFPSLFPFFVISEVLLGFGIVHFIGTLLDPLMKPLFRIPGSGGFVAAMGYASGYPVGAKLTAKLWEQKLVNREEAERLVAFTTSSDPIFLIGAVSVGFFHNPKVASILALAHYGGGLMVGLIMRFHGSKSSKPQSKADRIHGKGRLRIAFYQMHQARIQDGRGLGQLLSQAINSSLQLIIVVGGLVVFFSVILEVLTQARLMSLLYSLIHGMLQMAGLPSALSEPIVGGLFEVTLGARFAGEAGSSIPLQYKVAAAAFILSWGGLSVHAQITSILNHTNLRYLPFMVARFIHAIISAILTFLLWDAVMGKDYNTVFSAPAWKTYPLTGWSMNMFSLNYRILIYILFMLLFISFIIHCFRRIRLFIKSANRK
ncbi:sporulation integral membrane protein YlbJ [Paenibacillus sediminis]|uniref:Sporulation integral membrane protein YlbJ n=1 Tax=Paenibacillus sediminis TaxID=664909 RepID=A0ABS4H600_9BACL|nr:sporulation integral membrane protein YlbJ [Paenibacillus sediminis]MBP1937964.1 sporulation integral membrane protein YlbJ [Paenibacillus sediminis]